MTGAERTPIATYRLQIRGDLDLHRASELAGYLAELGVDFVYLSPPFAARAGSSHGYDVVDPTRIDPAIGGNDGFAELSARCRELGLGLMIDIVPNHLATDADNALWWDVLEAGAASPHSPVFDVDWAASDGRLLLPVLGAELEHVIPRGELRIERDGGALLLAHFDQRLPLALSSYRLAIAPALEQIADAGARSELEAAIAAADAARTAAERRAAKDLLARACTPSVAPALDAVLARFAAARGDEAVRLFEPLLALQHYRLRFWRGRAALNYRRFFSISDLVGLRSEDPEVFALVHRKLLALCARDQVQGVRVDHPDGLRDPIGYTTRLAGELARAREGPRPYLVIEKILTDDESLPDAFPVDGTTGYEVLGLLDAAFVDELDGPALVAAYARLTGRTESFDQAVLEAKRHVLDTTLQAELAALARRAAMLCRSSPDALRTALRELVAGFPRYRSYVRPDATALSASERAMYERAIAAAMERLPGLRDVFAELRSLLFFEPPVVVSAETLARAREVLLRLQQLTGPAAAKGVEDTASYRWFPLASLCEVGGNPARLGVGLSEFHARNAERQNRFPASLIATSTHDTKRGEDVRARLHALSEIPAEWEAACAHWQGLNRRHKRQVGASEAPDANDEYLIYQTLLGAWPLAGEISDFGDRLRGYLEKCLREAKRHSSWIEPNPDYETATLDFCTALVDAERSPEFRASFDRFERRIAEAGMRTSLSRTVIKAALPGVPDYYQGSELWDLSLVDPDNRRPVDWQRHRELLGEVASADPGELFSSWRDGRIKLLVTQKTLAARRRNAAVLVRGAYLPVTTGGRAARRVVAFARVAPGGRAVVACAGRFFARGEADFEDTRLLLPRELPSGSYECVITGRRFELASGGALDVSELFAVLPCSLLEQVA